MNRPLSERDRELIWHPYTQMKAWPEAIGITKGKGLFLEDEDGNQYMDLIASWWVNLHGHSHPYIAKKISEQAASLEHCIFAGFTHEPAVRLAERLLPILPGRMAKIFYSDNGSTAVEVALKMAVQYYQNRGTPRRKIIALEGAYHGDTVGAMSVSERSLFTRQFDHWLFDVQFIPFPEQALTTLNILEQALQAGDVAALIVEPLVQGSAGMRMYPPKVLSNMIQLCHSYGTLVIADEVMTGFGRTGKHFACDAIKDTGPDLICLSKGLTGGTMPMGITACTLEIFDAFLSDDATKTLYHGHSFTANPLACAAALASLDLLLEPACQHSIDNICLLHAQQLLRWQDHPAIRHIRQCGTILALELNTGAETDYLNKDRDFIYKFFLSHKLLLRPLGNIIYLIPPYCISSEQLQQAYEIIELFLNQLNIRYHGPSFQQYTVPDN